MICVRCGYCCVEYDVIIVNPKHVKPNLTQDELNEIEDGAIHKPSGQCCPHLKWHGNTCECQIHHHKWYKETPCHQFGQIESDPSDFCRLGQHIIKTRPDYYSDYCRQMKNCDDPVSYFNKILGKKKS